MLPLLYSLCWVSAFISIFLNHPLSFGFILLTQTMMISILTGMFYMNFWFSYILFLIMIGGMLVLFIYMTSIASNEKFKVSKAFIPSVMIMFMMLMLIFISKDMYFFSNYMNLPDMTKFNMLMMNTSITKYMNLSSFMIFMMLIIYLLITMIAVVKVTDTSFGPLRQKF